MSCYDCNFFKPFPLITSLQGDCILHGEYHVYNDGCMGWEARKTDVDGAKKKHIDKALEILKMEHNCYERQSDCACYFGDARCVKCDYNIRQGTISEHMEALKVAIKSLEGRENGN